MSQEFTDNLLQDLAFLKEVTGEFQNDPSLTKMFGSLADRARRLLMREMEYSRNLLDLKVLILGEFNSGKSSFVNTLLGEVLCPVGVKPNTCGFTKFVYGERIKFLTKDQEISFKDYHNLVQTKPVKTKASADSFRVCKPHPLLKGVSLVDTPGLSNPFLQYLEDTWLPSELVESDAVILVVNASDRTGLKHSLNSLYKRRSCNPRLRWYLVLSWSDLLGSDQLNALKDEIKSSFPDWFEKTLIYSSRLSFSQELSNEPLYSLFRKLSMERLEILRSKRLRAWAEYSALRNSTLKDAVDSLKPNQELDINRRFVNQFIGSLQPRVQDFFNEAKSGGQLSRLLFKEQIGKELKKVSREIKAEPCFLTHLQNGLTKLLKNSRILQILFSDTLQSRDSALRNKVSRINSMLSQELPLRKQLGAEQLKNLTAEQMGRFLGQTVMEVLSWELSYSLGHFTGQNESFRNAVIKIRSYLGDQACA